MLLGCIGACLSAPFLLSSPSGFPISCMFVIQIVYVDGVPQIFDPVYFFVVCFSFCSSDQVISIILSSSLLIFSFAWPNLLNPVVNFSFELLYFSTIDFLFGSFKNFYLFTDILFLFCLYIIFLISLNPLFVVSFNSFSTSKLLYFTSFCSRSSVWASSGTISIIFFFKEPYFYVFFNTLGDFFCCWKLDSLIL